VKQPSRQLSIWAWGKRGARGKRKLWEVRIFPITLQMCNMKTGNMPCP
jgi:hypothetical protein